MNSVVEKFHVNGFVHGDLRLSNFIGWGDNVYLVFDWGTKEGLGDATLPDVRLSPNFTRGLRRWTHRNGKRCKGSG
jgi:hypothetical protein